MLLVLDAKYNIKAPVSTYFKFVSGILIFCPIRPLTKKIKIRKGSSLAIKAKVRSSSTIAILQVIYLD